MERDRGRWIGSSTSPPPSWLICHLPRRGVPSRPTRPHGVRRRSVAAGACTPSSVYCAAMPRSRTGVPPSLSVSAMMSRPSHWSNWRSSCHPVGAYHPRPSPTTVTEITPPSTASSISSQPQTLAAALICSLLPSASSASQDQNMEICELRIFLVLSPLSYSPTLWCFWFQFCLNLICNFFDSYLGLIYNFSM